MDSKSKRLSALSLCLLLSLAFHMGIAVVLVLSIRNSPDKPTAASTAAQRTYCLALTTPPKEDKAHEQQEHTKEQKPFAKTNPDLPQQHPDHAAFEGQRNTRAEGMDNTTRSSNAPIPTMEGEEKEENNTVQQERQDGDIEFYGKNDAPQTPPADATEQEHPSPPAPQTPQGIPDATTTPEPATGNTPATAQETTESQSAEQPNTEGELHVSPPQDEQPPQENAKETPPPAVGTPEGTTPTPEAPPVVQVRRPVYDPTQADHAQPPGLRTEERRSRSTGQFVIGRMPACNVEATPRGQYEELIYRRIARQWYFACDQHRGDIIPGTIIIAIRITEKGTIESMNLVNRRGAGVSQQSFTFSAIRSAQIPPMPKEVQKTLIGNLLEIIITFDFN